MNRRALWLGGVLVIAAAGSGTAQQAGPASPSPFAPGLASVDGPRRNQLYEDVEVMRRILKGTVQRLYASAVQNWSWRGTNSTFGDQGAGNLGFGGGQFGMSGGGGFPGGGFGGFGGVSGDSAAGASGGSLADPAAVLGNFGPPSAGLDVEGTYLRGVGIVYTATLPRHLWSDRGAAPADEAEPKHDTVWDEVRRDVRGEKVPPRQARKPGSAPRIDQAVLRALYDNGHHIALLGDNEQIVVALTFREAEGLHVTLVGEGSASAAKLQGEAATQFLAQTQPPKPEDSRKPDARTLELLGDLRLGEKRPEEAADCYRKALEANPQSADLYTKLAEAYLACGQSDKALAVLQRAQEHRGKAAPRAERSPAAGSPRALPPKLVIAVSKRLLDAAGQGRMTFEEFTKNAAVEYVSFSGSNP